MFLALCAWSIYEALCALGQILGLGISGNARFAMTGNFLNPGPLGGFLAISMGVTFSYIFKFRKRCRGLYRKIMMTAACTAFALCFVIFPATLSRTAWLAFGVALLAALLQDDSARLWARRHKKTVVVLGAAAVLLFAGAFFLKKDSAIGRLHIWRIECLAILKNPLGTGPGSVLGTYGKVQEEFFREHLEDVSDSVVEVAGCPEYAFNEYLHIGIEYGIVGALIFASLLAAAIIILVRHRSIYAGGLIAWAVFALASYPLSVPRIDILLGILLASAAFCIPFPAPARHLAAAICIAAGIIVCVRSVGRPEFRAIYDKGYNEFRFGEYENSIRTLSEGADISSDPLFHVIMGRDYEALGNVEAAEEQYYIARYMVPCRIYPLARLTRLYVRNGRDEDALECAETALNMSVNERHLNMVRLRDELSVTRDSLKCLLRK